MKDHQEACDVLQQAEAIHTGPSDGEAAAATDADALTIREDDPAAYQAQDVPEDTEAGTILALL